MGWNVEKANRAIAREMRRIYREDLKLIFDAFEWIFTRRKKQ